jgi:hypothetical protein
MNIQSLIDKFSHPVPPFVAPVLPGTQRVYTRIASVPYTYHVSEKPGWHKLKGDKRLARSVGEPEMWEINSYLELLKPSWRLNVLYRLGGQSWLCLPDNLSDASQKGWNAGPVAVHLISDTVEPFDTIQAQGGLVGLVYRPGSASKIHGRGPEDMLLNVTIGNGLSTEVRQAVRMVKSRMESVRIAEAEKAKADQLKTTEGRLRYQLSFMGAELVSWKESGYDLIVSWKDNGIEYQSRVTAQANGVSAGICLSGQDSKYNLAGFVSVMREARQLNRPGAQGHQDEDYNEDDDD